MNDNPLQDFNLREFERDLRTIKSVQGEIQNHRKHLKRLRWTLFGILGFFAVFILLVLFRVLDAAMMKYAVLYIAITTLFLSSPIGRLESGLKVLLLRKVMLEEQNRGLSSATRSEASRT